MPKSLGYLRMVINLNGLLNEEFQEEQVDNSSIGSSISVDGLLNKDTSCP